MELNDQCYCCLLRPAAKNLKAPYTRLGITEIYSDMLEECFKIHLLDSGDECGICEVCVGRLRDASDFKLQVRRSQAELQARLERALHIKKEESPVKSELSGDEDDIDEEVNFTVDLKSEKSDPLPSEEDDTQWNYMMDLDVKSDDEVDIKEEDMTSRRSVRLARVRGDEASPAAECEAADHDSSLMTLRSQIRTHKEKYRCENTTFHELDMTEVTCDVCDKKFTSKQGLKQHELTHMKNKPYSCEVCNKRFAGVSLLTLHKRSHNRKKEFCCEICGKQCSCLVGLNYHKLSHTGEKPHDCDKCHKRFISKPGLKAHLRVHSGLKPYSCGVCGKKFSQSSNLIKHKLIHTDDRPEFSCDICGNKFLAKQKLQTHRMIHTGEKPHSCQICGKDFRAKHNLKTHMEIHAEGKTYSCELCSKTYSTKESLRQHKRVHTKNAGKSKCD